MKVKQSFSFGVRSSNKNALKSGIWKAWCVKNDVYIAGKDSSGVLKVSLHASRICNFSLTSELMTHDPPVPNGSRRIIQWTRQEHRGLDHGIVLQLFFMMINGGVETAVDTTNVFLLADAPTGFCTEVAVFYSDTDPREWNSTVWLAKNIMAVFKTEDNSYVTFRSRVVPLPDEEFQRRLSIQHSAGSMMFIGEKSKKTVSGGHSTMIVADSLPHLGRIYIFEKVDLTKAMGSNFNWSVQGGNKPRDTTGS